MLLCFHFYPSHSFFLPHNFQICLSYRRPYFAENNGPIGIDLEKLNAEDWRSGADVEELQVSTLDQTGKQGKAVVHIDRQ